MPDTSAFSIFHQNCSSWDRMKEDIWNQMWAARSAPNTRTTLGCHPNCGSSIEKLKKIKILKPCNCNPFPCEGTKFSSQLLRSGEAYAALDWNQIWSLIEGQGLTNEPQITKPECHSIFRATPIEAFANPVRTFLKLSPLFFPHNILFSYCVITINNNYYSRTKSCPLLKRSFPIFPSDSLGDMTATGSLMFCISAQTQWPDFLPRKKFHKAKILPCGSYQWLL